MKTKIHTYSFNLNNASEREPYIQLKARLSAEVKAGKRGHCLNVYSENSAQSRKHADMVSAAEKAGVVTLETEHLFGNQWNSKEAGRVFDWYEGINFNNKLLKFGYYLEITPEMEAIRRNTVACGYTGQQFPVDCGMVFNATDEGLRSYGLKESELSMLRLLPIWPEGTKRPELTPEEREMLLPLYLQARSKIDQEQRAKQRAKQRAEIEAEFTRDQASARKEYDGKAWCLDHGINLENVIFYNHTGQFSFGWRNPYGPKSAEAMRAKLADFPFDFEIKTEGAK